MSEDIPIYRLLQPELMTSDELIQILTRNGLNLDFGKTDQQELLNIYKRVALPLPQRTYGDTWRERRLAAKQNRSRCTNEQLTAASTSKNVSTSSKHLASAKRPQLTPKSERLKPPIDSVGWSGKKIIKLTSSSKSDNLDFTVKDRKKALPETKTKASSQSTTTSKITPEPSKRQKIIIDFSDSSQSTPSPKIIGTKRPSDKNGSSQPKPKHSKIVI